MKPPPLPPDLPEANTPLPPSGLTSGRIVSLILAVMVAAVAAIRSGSLLSWPLMTGMILLPLWWLGRLVHGVRHGVITSRIRTGSRTTRLIAFTISGKPDIYHRKSAPFRFWMTWLIECALFLFITPFFLVIVLGPIIEGGPK